MYGINTNNICHFYMQETEQLRHRNMIDKKCLRRGGAQNTLEEEKFNKFVHTARWAENDTFLLTSAHTQ